MSHCTAHQSEALAGLLFEQPLDFELGFGRAGNRRSQVEYGLAFWRSSIELRLDQHECCTAQDAIDQKEIVETVCVNSRNPPLLHSHSPDTFRTAASAREPNSHLLISLASELVSHPLYYGCITREVPMRNRPLEHFGTYAAWGRA